MTAPLNATTPISSDDSYGLNHHDIALSDIMVELNEVKSLLLRILDRPSVTKEDDSSVGDSDSSPTEVRTSPESRSYVKKYLQRVDSSEPDSLLLKGILDDFKLSVVLKGPTPEGWVRFESLQAAEANIDLLPGILSTLEKAFGRKKEAYSGKLIRSAAVMNKGHKSNPPVGWMNVEMKLRAAFPNLQDYASKTKGLDFYGVCDLLWETDTSNL